MFFVLTMGSTIVFGITEIIIRYIDDVSKATIKKFMDDWRTSAEVVYALLEKLLVWSNLHQGKMEYFPETIPIDLLADQNVNLFTPVARQKQICLKSVIPTNTTGYADRNMIDTVMRNLLSNALKFTPAQGTVEISARQSNHHIEVAVADIGVGIHEEHLAKLFRIDHKYTNVGTSGETGTGLGLILCTVAIDEITRDIFSPLVPCFCR
jgi:two-component system sensor histidine kinase/response regulator